MLYIIKKIVKYYIVKLFNERQLSANDARDICHKLQINIKKVEYIIE